MGGGKGGSSGSSSEVRFAPYLEAAHQQALSEFWTVFAYTKGASPYGDYEQIDIDEGFFGIRTDDPSLTYEIKNYPSLWDMFGKFMAGLDIHDLWSDVYDDILRGPELENAVQAQSVMLQDEIDTNVVPKFVAGMRDINSVNSSAFIIGKSIIQDAHVREINSFSSKLRITAFTTSAEMWSNHLNWSRGVIASYAEIFKLYYATRLDMDRANLEYPAKDAMWDINLFDHARGILGALSGSPASTSGGGNEPSQAQKSIGGALSGAAAGAMVGSAVPGVGTAVGAVVGGVLGLAASFF